MWRATTRPCARSPTGCTAGAAITGSARNCCWESAACGRSGSSARSPGTREPEVFHTNEGHAGFLGLERIREYVSQGLSFSEALVACRAGTVFTTHTPVSAGIDRFPTELIEKQFGGTAEDPALPSKRVLALGAETFPGGDPGVFNMAVMGLRLAQRANGVSRLHGKVSRQMFTGLWPGFDPAEVPIGSVTNGVHAPAWVAAEILELAAGQQPPGRARRRAACRKAAWRRTARPGDCRGGWPGADLGDPPAAPRAACRGGPAPAARVLAAARRLRRGADLDR